MISFDKSTAAPRTPVTYFRAQYAIARAPGLRSAPKVLEPTRRKLGVFDGMLDVAMAKLGLQGARIVASIGQGEAAGVAQHMRMCLEKTSTIAACAVITLIRRSFEMCWHAIASPMTVPTSIVLLRG